MTASKSHTGFRARRRPRAGRSRAWLIALLCLGLAAAALAAVSAWLLPRGDRILPGVAMGQVRLGGLSREQARRAVDDTLHHATEQAVTLVAAGQRREVTLQELGIRYDADAVAQAAYALGREGHLLRRVLQAVQARRDGLAVTPRFALDRGMAEKVLQAIATQIDQPSTDAVARWDDAAKRVVIDPGREGGRLDMAGALTLVSDNCLARLSTGTPLPAELPLPYAARAPRVSARTLAPVDTVLGEYTTSFATSSRNRASNVTTAAEAIDGIVVMPGEVFSFNQTVGPRTSDNGFRIAPVIIEGQLQPGVGGGVCQVSTTLYNAALLSGMPIVSRNHHSFPVHYVPAGRDATVSYGAIDFKFRNGSAAPIVVDTAASGRRLTVRLLGAGPAPVVRIERSGTTRLGGRRIVKKDPTLPAGKQVVVQKGGSGLAVTVTRVIGEGEQALREVVSRDRYIGEPRIVRVGTGPAARDAASAGSATATSLSDAPAPAAP